MDWVARRQPSIEKMEELELKAYRDVAVVRGIYSMQGRDGKSFARYQFLDVYAYRQKRWQALTREVAELPDREALEGKRD